MGAPQCASSASTNRTAPSRRAASAAPASALISGPSALIGIRLLTADDQRENVFSGVLADPESETPAIRPADEMRPLDAECAEHGDEVGGLQRHRVRLRLGVHVAPPEPAVIRVDEPELAGELLECSRQL